MNILVINSGSSSIKFHVFTGNKTLIKGKIDGIGPKKSHTEAMEEILKLLPKNIDRIGHRVVHGGNLHKPTKITDQLIKILEKLSSLAPLHNPHNIEGIKAYRKIFPHVSQYAIFDTAFHQTLPEHAYRYALPREYEQKYGIRKYGFHGTSHEFVSQEAIHYLKKRKEPWQRIISCHIGNGVSITAIKNGKSIDTSMGFTPLEGVMMGTRCGSIDPSIPLTLQKILKKSPEAIYEILNNQSGLLAIAEKNSDMRNIYAKNDKKSEFAITMFCYQISKYIGASIAVLGGLDALIFTGGIGENAWYVREKICKTFEFLKLKLNSTKNRKNAWEIQTKSSSMSVLIIPTNEELAIAQKIW